MPRYRNRHSGAVINVPAEKAARLGSGWELPEDHTSGSSRYGGWKIQALRTEISRRNQHRIDAERIPAKGSKADLAAALERDDL